MHPDQSYKDAGSFLPAPVERRGKPRIYGFFPAWVRAIGEAGEAFETEGALDNLSASGLHLSLARCARVGSRLFVVVHLKGRSAPLRRGPCLAFRATVLRVEPQPEQRYGIAARITSHRFL